MKEQIKGKVIKNEIKVKFKSIARFCKIADRDYKATNTILAGKDVQALVELRLIANCTWDRPLLGELSKDQKMKIRTAITAHESQKAFCKRYKFNQTWLSRLLSDADYGAVRVNSPNLKRLIKILNIEL